MDSPGPKPQSKEIFTSLSAVEKIFSTHGETGTASPSPCCPAETAPGSCTGQGWAQPQFGIGKGSRLCPPRGAGKGERSQAGREHAGGCSPLLSALTPEPQAAVHARDQAGCCLCRGAKGSAPTSLTLTCLHQGPLFSKKKQPAWMDAEEGKGRLGAITCMVLSPSITRLGSPQIDSGSQPRRRGEQPPSPSPSGE